MIDRLPQTGRLWPVWGAGAQLDVLTAVRGWALWPEASPASPVRYRFLLTGPYARTLDIVVSREGAQMEAGSADHAQVHLHCSVETLVWVMYGRLTLADAIAPGRLSVDGDPALVTAFGNCFRGV